MAEYPHSSSSDSESDSSTVSLSDVLHCEKLLQNSKDSSSDSEGSYQKVASKIHIQVKEMRQDRDSISRFIRWKSIGSDAYFLEIIRPKGKIKFFPERMRTFLSTKYKRKYRELSNLEQGTSFIYLAKSLIVTLNLDKTKVRQQRSLVFDACIISEENPVCVVSVFNTKEVSPRLEKYNTFVARGVTDALRTWSREDIGITNSAVTLDHNLIKEVRRLRENPGVFHIQSSLKMWRDKAEKAAIALLRSVSVASSFPLLYPEKAISDQVWFLTKSEFQFLTNFIDLQGSVESVEGDELLLQTEIYLRLKKLYTTAMLMTSVTAFVKIAGKEGNRKLLAQLGNPYSSLGELEDGGSNYELVITDVPIAKTNIPMVISIGVSKPDDGIPKKEKTTILNWFHRRKRTNKYDMAGREAEGSVSAVDIRWTPKNEQARFKSKFAIDSDHEVVSLDNNPYRALEKLPIFYVAAMVEGKSDEGAHAVNRQRKPKRGHARVESMFPPPYSEEVSLENEAIKIPSTVQYKSRHRITDVSGRGFDSVVSRDSIGYGSLSEKKGRGLDRTDNRNATIREEAALHQN